MPTLDTTRFELRHSESTPPGIEPRTFLSFAWHGFRYANPSAKHPAKNEKKGFKTRIEGCAIPAFVLKLRSYFGLAYDLDSLPLESCEFHKATCFDPTLFHKCSIGVVGGGWTNKARGPPVPTLLIPIPKFCSNCVGPHTAVSIPMQLYRAPYSYMGFYKAV